MSATTFNSVTYDGLSFTNISVTETATGSYSPFVGSTASVVGASTTLGAAVQFGGFSSGVYYANSSDVLNLSYTVTSTSLTAQIDAMSQLYTTDLQSGPGTHLTAQETVYDTAGDVLATDTYVLGGSDGPDVTFSQPVSTANVQLTLTLSVDSTGTPAGSASDGDVSALTISGIQQSFGTVPASSGAVITGSSPPANATIGSIVWLDADDDGILDNGETGAADVTVALLNNTGSIVATTTTDANGHYQFSAAAGTYEVQVLAPAGDSFTTPNGIATAGQTSSVVNAAGVTPLFTVASGQSYTAANAGLVPPTASLGSTVWLDTNQDGLLDANETGVAGVTVELLNASATAILQTQTTDAGGHYLFTGLAAGTYQVAIVPPADDGFTTENVATAGGINSNVDSTGHSGAVTLTGGQTGSINAGLVKAAIGDYVWLDLNQNGLQDAGETGAAGVTVQLLAADTLVLKISEDAYQGDAQYTVAVNGVQIGGIRTATASHAAGADNIVTLTGDFGTNPAVVVTFLNDLWGGTDSADRNLYVDGFTYNGLSQTAAGRLTTDGSQNFGLIGAGETVLATTTTDSTGHYAFTGLNPGVYEVKFAAPAGSAFTVQNAGTNTALDSNASKLTGVTAPITLTAGQVDNTIDAGLIAAGGLSVLKQPGSVVVNACGQMTYSFAVSNTGSAALTNVRISDNVGSAANPNNVTPSAVCSGGYNVGDVNHNGILDAGETWQYTVNVNAAGCGQGSSSPSSASITGVADTVTVTAQTVAGTSCTTTTASGSHLTGGCTAWLNSTFKPTSCADGSFYSFKNVSCTIAGAGLSPVTVNCPDATVTFSRSCTTATTVFNAAANCWVTTLPAGCNPGNVFLTGCPQAIANGCDLTNATVTWSVGSSSNNCGASSLAWDGNCTGFSSFSQNNCSGSTDYNQIGVKSCDTIGANGVCAGAPVKQLGNSNCGSPGAFTTPAADSNLCGTTCSVTATGTTLTATDTKEVQVLGCNSNISLNGTATKASLAAAYGTAQTLEFVYTPGNTVSVKQVQAGLASVTGTNSAALAFIAISNNANPFATGASIYFEGEVTTGEKIFADAATNVMTNSPVTGGHFSCNAGANIYAFVFSSQQAFRSGAAPVQTMTYDTSGSQAMHLGDTIGSLSVIGYVGSGGGHLVS